MSVRFTTRFGAPAVAGIALGHGVHVWLLSAALSGALVGTVVAAHTHPALVASLRRLLRRR